MVTLLARAICQLPDGRRRRQYVSQLCLGGAFIIAMDPPPLGAELVVTIAPFGTDPVPPTRARVINTVIHPRHAELSGFGVVFTHMDDEALDRLSMAISELQEQPKPRLDGSLFFLRDGSERRIYPRLSTKILSIIENAEGKEAAQVLNLSMSGALLEIAPGSQGIGLFPGTDWALTLLAPDMPEDITLMARVAWTREEESPQRVGVQFHGMGSDTRIRFEGLLLEMIAKQLRTHEA